MELQMRFFQKHKKYFYFVMKKQISESKNKENLELPDVEQEVKFIFQAIDLQGQSSNEFKNSNAQREEELDSPQSKASKTLRNPILYIHKQFLYYMNKVKLKHGLVFKKGDRMALNKKSKFKWQESHHRNPKDERIKAMNSLEKRKIDLSDPHQFKFLQLVQIMIQVSEIFPQEVTEEIYDLLSLVIESLLKKSQEILLHCSEGMVYLTRQFTKKKIKYCLEKIDKQTVNKQFYLFIPRLRKSIDNLFQRPEDWRSYAKQQRKEEKNLEDMSQNK